MPGVPEGNEEATVLHAKQKKLPWRTCLDHEFGAAFLNFLQSGVVVLAKASPAGQIHRKDEARACARVRPTSGTYSNTAEVPSYVRREYKKKRKVAKQRRVKARQRLLESAETMQHLTENEVLREEST